MCECITKIPEDLKKNNAEINGRKVLDVDFKFISFPFVNGQLYTALQIPIEFELEGRKTKLTKNIFAKYCPFCGEECEYSKTSKEEAKQ